VVVRMLVTSLLSALASATPPRLLVYVPTHLSDDHAACLTCWPAMLAHAPLLRTADVLVYAGGPAAAVPAARLSWESIVKALPNRNATIFFSSFNPGYQDGAKYAMHVALTSGWFDAYEWVVRINPDVLVFDESRLTLAMAGLFGPSPGRYEGVFASCRRNKPCYGRGCEHGLIQTDVLAVRPDVVPRDAFACWNSSVPRSDPECGFARNGAESHAEEQATRAFRPIVQRRADAWLNLNHTSGSLCRINTGGLRHVDTHKRPSDRLLCAKACPVWKAADPWQRFVELSQHLTRKRRAKKAVESSGGPGTDGAVRRARSAGAAHRAAKKAARKLARNAAPE